MAKQTRYLDYVIYLPDRELVYQLQNDGLPPDSEVQKVIYQAPDAAALQYEAPLIGADEPFAESVPCTYSVWFGSRVTEAGAEWSAQFPTNVASFTRKSGGLFGLSFLFGNTITYKWRGRFEWSPALVNPEEGEGEPGPMSQRKWIDGAEMAAGENEQGNASELCSRVASRHVGGFGYLFDNATLRLFHTHTTLGASASRIAWERFYVRRTRTGSGTFYLHRTVGATSSNAGIRISITNNGGLLFENIDATAVVVSSGTLPPETLPLGEWKRIDLIYSYATGAAGAGAVYTFYVNGVLTYTHMGMTDSLGNGAGMGQNQNIGTSDIGNSPALNGHTVHIDDWIGCVSWPDTTALDWHNGSRVVRVRAKEEADDDGGWAGQLHSVDQAFGSGSDQTTRTSSTSADRLAIVTDADASIDAIPQARGIAALVVLMYGFRDGSANGSLGYKLPGESEVLSTVTQSGGSTWVRKGYLPNDLTLPLTPLADLELAHVKGASTDQATVYEMGAVAELIGRFHPEDESPTSLEESEGEENEEELAVPPRLGIPHNSPYPNSIWGRAAIPPVSAYGVVTGTYTGNGTTIELPFRLPIHMLVIRRLASASDLLVWFSSANAGHKGGQESYTLPGPVQVLMDPDYPAPVDDEDQILQSIARIVGAGNSWNVNGESYAFFALMDPGMRFAYGTGLFHPRSSEDNAQALEDDTFEPEAAFIQNEIHSVGSTIRFFYKGPGHAASEASPVSATVVSDALTFAEGAISSGGGLTAASVANAAVMLFRRDDGSEDPGIPQVLQLTSYIGDGSASRTINLTPASGRRPLIAFVVPHNNTGAAYRDPSHTGSNSRSWPTTEGALRITSGGIDQISVGSSLNANGVVYDVFVIPGSTTAGNNGWSIDGEFFPVEPDSPSGPQWGEEPDEEAENPDPEEPEPEPDGDDEEFDFGEDCIGPSTTIINRALSMLGSSKQVDNVLTDRSVEAQAARLHFSEAVNVTLRAAPWSFATRYADLTLEEGSVDEPVNGDWIYAFRLPARCIMARRVVTPGGFARNPNIPPIPFKVATIDTDDGDLAVLFCNREEVQLEYTVRLACVASSGDATFRRALTARVAAELAPSVARDEKKLAAMLALYEAAVDEAKARDGNEQQPHGPTDADWITARN